jgi:hypothetical protein
MLVSVSGDVPVLVSVIVCGELPVFLSCVPKVRLVGDNVTAGSAWAAMLEKTTRPAVTQIRVRALDQKRESGRKPVHKMEPNGPQVQRTGMPLLETTRL